MVIIDLHSIFKDNSVISSITNKIVIDINIDSNTPDS